MPNTFFDDPDFKNTLVTLLIQDRKFLSQNFLGPDDFKPVQGIAGERDRWILAQLSINFYEKYRQPIGDLIRVEAMEYCDQTRLDGKRKQTLVELANLLRNKKVVGIEAVVEKVAKYKSEIRKKDALQEMIDLQSAGELSDEKFLQVCRDSIRAEAKTKIDSTNYFEDLEKRISRRTSKDFHTRYPALFIAPLDQIAPKIIARKHIGLVLAPYKRGKSLMLAHIALAYCIQRLHVLYITLENPKPDVEDRFDTAISGIPMDTLTLKPNTLRNRFERYKAIVKGRLQIVDGVGKGYTVSKIQAIWETFRDQGFTADAIIIDYDEKIATGKKRAEKRFEVEDLYNDLGNLAGATDTLLWTACQTQRDTKKMKIINGDVAAESIFQIRSSTFVMGLGLGEWGPDSMYLWVAAHRNGVEEIGCNIYTDKPGLRIYDHERTVKKMMDDAVIDNP